MARRQWWTDSKEYMNEIAARNGHTLTWKRLPREHSGCALVFEGTCTDCGATVQIDRYASTCATARNARDETCSGPGTAVLTAIEQERSSEVMAGIIGDYMQALADAGVTFEPPKAPFRNPLAPANECGLMSTDGYTCIRRLNKRGTHNGNEWGGPEGHVGTRPGAGFTHPFDNDQLLYA